MDPARFSWEISAPVVTNVGADTLSMDSLPVCKNAVVATPVVAYVISTHRSRLALPRLIFSNANLSNLELSPRFSCKVWLCCDGFSGSGSRGVPNTFGSWYEAPLSGQIGVLSVVAITVVNARVNPAPTIAVLVAKPRHPLRLNRNRGIGIRSADKKPMRGT